MWTCELTWKASTLQEETPAPAKLLQGLGIPFHRYHQGPARRTFLLSNGGCICFPAKGSMWWNTSLSQGPASWALGRHVQAPRRWKYLSQHCFCLPSKPHGLLPKSHEAKKSWPSPYQQLPQVAALKQSSISVTLPAMWLLEVKVPWRNSRSPLTETSTAEEIQCQFQPAVTAAWKGTPTYANSPHQFCSEHKQTCRIGSSRLS